MICPNLLLQLQVSWDLPLERRHTYEYARVNSIPLKTSYVGLVLVQGITGL